MVWWLVLILIVFKMVMIISKIMMIKKGVS